MFAKSIKLLSLVLAVAFVLSSFDSALATIANSNAPEARRASATTIAQNNVLVVPGQEEMQPEQADIMDRTQNQEAADAAKSEPVLEAVPEYPVYEAPVVERNTEVYGNEVDERQRDLERPAGRQLGLERKNEREMELDMPDGPGQKY